MKTYTTASNARRAATTELAKALGKTKDEIKEQEGTLFTIEQKAEKEFFWRRVQIDTKMPQVPVNSETFEIKEEEKQFEQDNQQEMGFTEAGDAIPAWRLSLIEEYGIDTCPHCGVTLDNGVGLHGQDVNGKVIKHAKFIYQCLGCGEEFGPKIEEETKTTPRGKNTDKSTVTSPCKLVWSICEEMKGARRKDVLEACVNAGVAYYTARTQYQQWLVASRGETK